MAEQLRRPRRDDPHPDGGGHPDESSVGTPLDLWALVAPLVVIALPCMALVAALAVLFESIGWLRGGFGNVVYFFLFSLLITASVANQTYQPFLDFTGIGVVGDGIGRAAKLTYPESGSGFSFQALNAISAPQRFHYTGIEWTASAILPRIFFVLVAFGLTLLASSFFDRFNASKAARGGKQLGNPSASQTTTSDPAPLPQVRLTPLPTTRRFRFRALYAAELKMLLKGHRWWWYGVSLGLVVAQLAVPLESTPVLLAIAWLWMILLLSELGNREAQHNTREIVFSAPRPTLNQLPALCLAAVTVVALIGSGAFLRYLLGGETARLLAWAGGVLFIPSLALVMGVLTLSRKPFEVVYVTWMYIILNEASARFCGGGSRKPLARLRVTGGGLVRADGVCPPVAVDGREHVKMKPKKNRSPLGRTSGLSKKNKSPVTYSYL